MLRARVCEIGEHAVAAVQTGFAAIVTTHARAKGQAKTRVRAGSPAHQRGTLALLTCTDIHAQRVRDRRGGGLRGARRRRRARGKVRRANVQAEVGRAASRVQRHEERVGSGSRREEGDLAVRRHGDGGGGRPRLADASPKAVNRADIGHCGQRARRFAVGAGAQRQGKGRRAGRACAGREKASPVGPVTPLQKVRPAVPPGGDQIGPVAPCASARAASKAAATKRMVLWQMCRNCVQRTFISFCRLFRRPGEAQAMHGRRLQAHDSSSMADWGAPRCKRAVATRDNP